VKNNKGMFLSRISKKNNKHRYYITEEVIDVMEVEYNDSVINMYHYEYNSKYVGKNIDEALIKLLLLS
jgi:bifunctional N-acetylglucosamine-1-phosphate-uridyltransferase/glucosamine-1-phosphate-acetyltransferase GlmU-like protein